MTINKTRGMFFPMTVLITTLLLSVVCSNVSGKPMTERAKNENGVLLYHENGQTMKIEAWGPDGIRVQITPDGGGKTSDWALDIPNHRNADIQINEGLASLRNGNISIELTDVWMQDGLMEFFRHEGDRKISLLRQFDYKVIANNPGARTFYPTEDGLKLFRAELAFEPDNSERFYGMGENANRGHVDLKGSIIDLYQRHVKAVVPFVVSNKKYGFLWNNPSLGRVEFGMNRTRWISDGCRQMDFYITTGQSYSDILSHYADVTGHAPAFPDWAAGFWQCKLRYDHQEQFLNIAREFKRRNLPLSVLVIDFYHWKEFGDWKLDPRFWPDPKAMVKEMNELGYRIMVSPWTLVSEKSENYDAMKKGNMFTTSINNQCDTIIFDGHVTHQYDPTNPAAAAMLKKKWTENYISQGMKTFWLDPCDELHQIPDYAKVLFHIGPAKECHSAFVTAHQKNVYEALKEAGENEIVTLCRNAWAGSQRYGACPAPHDIYSTFDHMEEYMKAGLNVGMSGIPWWNCDIGGFHTADYNSPEFKERMIRWYQYGVFMPIFRTHGCRPGNEPWSFGEDTYVFLRSSIMLREKLRPYIMDNMKLASEKGTPIMRPLLFDFDADSKVYEVEDEFMFGPDILVAPITKYQQRSRSVYLPAGCDWLNAWTGEKLKGGQTITADAPLERIPVYIREGKSQLLDCFKGLYNK